jgi:sulfide:quinone oxidoreductase
MDAMARILILGGGFGGVTVATELRGALADAHEVVLVDHREHFMMGLRKPWAIAGVGTMEDGRRSRRLLGAKGIRFLEERVLGIDPGARSVRTEHRTLESDHLVVALGAEPRPDLVPGFGEHAHNLYDAASIPALRRAIERFQGGRIVIAVTGVPYKCPPAPYETAMLLQEHLMERGLGASTEVHVSTLQPMLMPNAGAEGSAWLAEQLTARGITFQVGAKVQRVEEGRLVLLDSTVDGDLLIGAPPHRPPAVVKESGLTGEGEWIQVDPGTLETGHERVYAIGDVTGIKLANGLGLPKAGVMAELEGKTVAAAIAAELAGRESPAPFDGTGFCFIEMGKHSAARVQGSFFHVPEPDITLAEPSSANAEAKRRFESERLEAWFA